MPSINLLPWREELRKERQQQFYIMVGVAVVAMLGVVAAAHMQVAAMIDHQEQRNSRLDNEVAALDKKIKEIKDLEKEKQNLLARMDIVQQLQTSRPEVVHLFDEMVTTLPEGVYLRSLEQRGRNIVLTGVAQSNARVSSFMRKLEKSDWLKDPRLDEIRAEQKKNQADLRASTFKLIVEQTNPQAEKEEGES